MRFLVNEDLKLLVGWNRKCACGSLKGWFINASNIKTKVNYHQYFRENKYWTKISKDCGDYYKFLVVRNPYYRAVSGYYDRIVCNEIKFLNFKKWARKLVQGKIKDAHFEKQTSEDFAKFLEFRWKWDRVIDIENLDQEIKKVNKDLGISIPIGHSGDYGSDRGKITIDKPAYLMNRSELKRTNPTYKQYYNKNIQKNIYSFYKNDFKYLASLGFNYSLL